MVLYFFLGIICFLFAFYSLRIFKNNILSPTFVISLMFGTSAFLGCWYVWRYQIVISAGLLIVVPALLSALLIGELLAKKIRIPQRQSLFKPADGKFSFASLSKTRIGNAFFKNNDSQNQRIELSVFLQIVFTLFSLATIILYIFDDIRIVRAFDKGSLPTSFSAFYSDLRNAVIYGGFVLTPYIARLNVISHSLALILCFIGSFNFFGERRKKDFFLWIVPALYIINTLLTSGRELLIDYVISIFVIFFLAGLLSGGLKERKNHRILLFVLGGGSILLIISFLVLGGLRSSQYTANQSQFEMLFWYFTSPLLAFNDYLKAPMQNTALFGQHCFSGIYEILIKIFPDKITRVTQYYKDFFFVGSLGTNVYTAMRRYIEDFGFFGSYLFCLFFGFLYSYIFERIKANPSAFGCATYGVIYYAVIEFSIEERLCNEIMSLNVIKVIFYLFIFCVVLFALNFGVKTPKTLFKENLASSVKEAPQIVIQTSQIKI